MIQPPSPPQKANEYLTELAEYYRELIEYHQQAAIAAAQQLGHVEALLGNDPGLPTHQVRSWLVDESNQHKAITPDSSNDEQLSSVGSFWFEGIDSSQELELVEDEENNPSEHLEEFTLPSDEQLQEFFREERGNMVQIDYVLHHFFDISEQTPRQELLELLTEQLKKGSHNQLWSQVPDSPDCWTFALSDFAEFAPSNQDNPLFPDLKSEVLPTKKVAELLSIQPEKIYEIKEIYGEELIQGTDYFQNNRGHYLWSKKGVDKLTDFKNKLESKKSRSPSILPSSPPPILPLYKGLGIEKAIKKLFNSNPDREWTISQVVTGIYGNVTKAEASLVRDKITKGLSQGHLTGLWRRVPRKVGVYKPN
ncbi:MAG: hypothetical protein QNJ37_25015 [Crocosphaera sp.]|nr:hypothetical protein [Crocosphaera sp.]